MTLFKINKSMVVHNQKSYTPWIANYLFHIVFSDRFIAIGITNELSFGWIYSEYTKRLLLGPLQLTLHKYYWDRRII